MTKNQQQPKLDLDFFENILLFNALTDKEYLSSIINYINPTLFNDKSIGRVIDGIVKFFSERGSLPSLTEVKARLTLEEDKKALSDVKIKLAQLDTSFNKEELIHNTEKFLKERFVYQTIINVAEKFSDQTFNVEDVLIDLPIHTGLDHTLSLSLKETYKSKSPIDSE